MLKLSEVKSNGNGELIGTREDVNLLRELRSEFIDLYPDCDHLYCEECPFHFTKGCILCITSQNLLDIINMINVTESE